MIGSNLVKALNEQGYNDILVVDNLKDGTKFINLVDLDIADYMDKEDFITQIMAGDDFGPIEAVFHEGACSATTEWDGKYMMLNNYEYSKELLHYCLEREIPFLYASSAATYGGRDHDFIEEPQYEGALNVYGYSKQLFDNYVRRIWQMLKHTAKPCRKSPASVTSTSTAHAKATKAACVGGIPPEQPNQRRPQPETV